jgi:hypothetical protein
MPKGNKRLKLAAILVLAPALVSFPVSSAGAQDVLPPDVLTLALWSSKNAWRVIKSGPMPKMGLHRC